jgi:hypothetical protein
MKEHVVPWLKIRNRKTTNKLFTIFIFYQDSDQMINTTENTEALFFARKEVALEVNTDETNLFEYASSAEFAENHNTV